MTASFPPIAPDARVVIVGGGVAALEATLALRALGADRLELVIVSADPVFRYRPLSVLTPFDHDPAPEVPLSALAASEGAELIVGEVSAVDTDARIVRTAPGGVIPYDVLIACLGAAPIMAVPGAVTFGGPRDIPAIQELLAEIDAGSANSIAFAYGGGPAWPFPLAELALLTATHARRRGLPAEVAFVTPESEPLSMLGPAASATTRELMTGLGITIHTDRYPVAFSGDRLSLVPHGELAADRCVSIPRLVGPGLPGLPQDDMGFIPIGRHAEVIGVNDVFAAGDATTFPLKHGGIASQEADAAAEVIAARAGAPITPQPFRPVVRGLLLAGRFGARMQTELSGAGGDPEPPEPVTLWSTPAKLYGRFIGPYLERHAGVRATADEPGDGTLEVDVEIDPAAQPLRPVG
ncbi:MAG: FAD-dependent oxidoreductase [Solirubrobacteraceae bacterium]